MADSGASVHITMNRSDLSEYEEIKDGIHLNTASKSTKPLQVRGKDAMFLTISEDHRGQEPVIRLYPVYYVTGVLHRYLSVGTLLNQGLVLWGNKNQLEFRTLKSNWLEFQCMPHFPGQTVYWLNARPTSAHSLLAKSMVMSIDYDIMHRRFAHPSMDVLRHASGNSQGFPSILIPKENSICPGCTLGKITSSLFWQPTNMPPCHLTRCIWIWRQCLLDLIMGIVTS